MRAAIYGCGALGTAVGALITKGGEKIDLIDVDPKQIDALKANGATLEGEYNFTIPVLAMYPDEAKPGYDAIFLATIEQANEEALRHIKVLLKSDGVLVSLQNGFTDYQLMDAVGDTHFMGCAVDWNAELTAPAHVVVRSAGDRMRAYIGKMPDVVSSPAMGVRTLLEKTGDVHYINNLIGARWGKLVINCSLSAVSTIYGGTFGDTISHKSCRDLIVSAGNECMKVVEALGISIPNFEDINFEKAARYDSTFGKWQKMRNLPNLIKFHNDATSIFLQNLEKKIPLDLEYTTGVVIQKGMETNVETPVIRKLQDTLQKIEKGQAKSGIDTIEKILKELK